MDPIAAAAQAMIDESCDELRTTIADLSPEALAWTPAPETSSIAVLVRHAASATRFLLRCAVEGAVDRAGYRAAERAPAFDNHAATAAELIEAITRMQGDAAALLAAADPATYAATVTFLNSPNEPPMGRGWALVHAVEHLREHVGHCQLTRQLLPR